MYTSGAASIPLLAAVKNGNKCRENKTKVDSQHSFDTTLANSYVISLRLPLLKFLNCDDIVLACGAVTARRESLRNRKAISLL